MHDREDSINRFAGAQLTATQGLGHRRTLKDAEVMRRVVAFVGQAAESVDPEETS